MSALRVVIFLAIISAVLFGMHFYLWLRLIRDTGLEDPWRTLATCALAVLGAGMVVGFPLMRVAPRSITSPMMWVAYVWMGLSFYLLVLFGVGDLVKVGIRTAAGGALDPARREALARGFAAGVGAIAAIFSGAAVWGATSGAIATQRVRVRVPRLPKPLSGYRIAQISDIHVGPTIGREFFQSIVDRVNALKPDLIAVTGDLVDGSVAQLGALVEPIRQLAAKDGVFFVTGNHEYYVPDLPEWLAYLAERGVRVLRNERVPIRGEAGFDLAGIDDLTAKSYGHGHGADLGRALAGKPVERPVVLLAHQPRQVQDAVRAGVDLQLSGHTHGGQMFPFSVLVRLFEPYLAGLYALGGTQLYVSRGTGYWGPPMRLGAPAEITELELVTE